MHREESAPTFVFTGVHRWSPQSLQTDGADLDSSPTIHNTDILIRRISPVLLLLINIIIKGRVQGSAT